MVRKLGLLCISFFAGRGMIEDLNIKISTADLHYMDFIFGFEGGGNLNMAIELVQSNSKDPLYIFLCTPKEKDKINTFKSFEDFCENPLEALSCQWQGKVSASNIAAEIDLAFDSSTQIELFAANCYTLNTYEVHVHSSAKNPHGWLSTSDVPYLYIYPLLAAIWGCILIYGLANWIPYRAFNVSLQKLFTGIPVFHVIENLFATWYWQQCSITGTRPINSNAHFILKAVAEGFEYLVLMHVADGYGILRSKLKFPTQVWSLAAVITISTLLMRLDENFLFFTIITYLLVLRYIFMSHSENIVTLSQQHIAMSERYPLQAHVRNSPLFEKLQMYSRVQRTIVIYVGMDIVFRWWAKGVLLNEKWIQRFVEELITILFLSRIAWSFRMRPFVPGFSIPSDNDMERVATPLWSPGMPVHKPPKSYSDWLNSEIAELIVVEHPKRDLLPDDGSLVLEEESSVSSRHYNIATWHEERLQKSV